MAQWDSNDDMFSECDKVSETSRKDFKSIKIAKAKWDPTKTHWYFNWKKEWLDKIVKVDES